MVFHDTQDGVKQSNNFANGLSLCLRGKHKLQVVESSLNRRKHFGQIVIQH